MMDFRDTKFLFFTGKGGVGKTSLSSAAAVQLADQGNKVLLISTDPASNLTDVLATEVGDKKIAKHPDLSNLSTINIDPEEAGESYKNRAVSSLGMLATPVYRNKVREQLSGACTVEIASFDEFTRFISGEANPEEYDYIVFDTAPTGHTLRLLELPDAWSDFLDHNEGASCIGPSTALKSNHQRYKEVVEVLKDPNQTTFYLVARAEETSLKEAARSAKELAELGMNNQRLLLNGIYTPINLEDEFAVQIAEKAKFQLKNIPQTLSTLPVQEFPLLPYNILGLEKLRSVFSKEKQQLILERENTEEVKMGKTPNLTDLVDDLEKDGHGLIMTMGKGGVGKTVTASAIAIALANRGHKVTLTTTDPAAHLTDYTGQIVDLPAILTVERIDPKVETEIYIEKAVAQRGAGKTEDQIKLIREDLNSPCTEEVAVFHAFSKAIRSAKRQFVVVDTAPTGHTLLLLDTTGSYHKQVVKQSNIDASKLHTPYQMIQDQKITKVILVTLPETTPIREAQSLQSDLERAEIYPYAWVINQSLPTAYKFTDPILLQKRKHQQELIASVKSVSTNNAFQIDYIKEEKIVAEML
ncbi:arsenical pump-driving ATPase [Flammeovirga aprica]|uniref:arsenite-transporting ATPase n=1 Tax=Flammeovirga aprica JL-4 TaxID=694437 RepID=A0A7X9RX56_9BACT|nr:arsenical pump-driving ATPase [Flammeovirga aprica]NME70310.1 arsenical pump-driving ATPase [Flammeovirga aprica JL-4]